MTDDATFDLLELFDSASKYFAKGGDIYDFEGVRISRLEWVTNSGIRRKYHFLKAKLKFRALDEAKVAA